MVRVQIICMLYACFVPDVLSLGKLLVEVVYLVVVNRRESVRDTEVTRDDRRHCHAVGVLRDTHTLSLIDFFHSRSNKEQS